MMPAQYREKMKALMRPGDTRVLDLDPSNVELLRSLGVRYFLTAESGKFFQALAADSRFRLLEPSRSYFQVFELRDPHPPYRWQAESHSAPASLERIVWQPERRMFRVKSSAAGRLVLVEQFYPGWRAEIDGHPVEIERWDDVFQAVRVAAGEHQITFEYHARTVWIGALVTALSLAALCVGVLRSALPARYTQRSRSA
jgi:hypothetical protein